QTEALRVAARVGPPGLAEEALDRLVDELVRLEQPAARVRPRLLAREAEELDVLLERDERLLGRAHDGGGLDVVRDAERPQATGGDLLGVLVAEQRLERDHRGPLRHERLRRRV